MASSRRIRPLAVVAGVVALVGLACYRALRSLRIEDVPLCPLVGRGRIGADWAARRGLEAAPVAGEIDDFGVYTRAGDSADGASGEHGKRSEIDVYTEFDATAVHPEVRRFYERTSEFALAHETYWHPGFRIGAWLAAHLTSFLEQLNLPGTADGRRRRLESRIARVPRTADSRGDSRVWTRTDPETGEAVFVAIYTTHKRGGVTYANVAVPLPWSNLSTVLRPELLEMSGGAENKNENENGNRTGTGVTFTTRGPGDGGLYLVTPLGAFSLPMAQRFRVWPASGETGDESLERDNADLRATHEMWVFGRQFLTITYDLERRTAT